MKKRTSTVIALSFIVIVFLATNLVGCSTGAQTIPVKPATTTVTVTDFSRRAVVIPSPNNIKRVAVLTSPQVLVSYSVGVQDRLSAVTNAVKQWSLLQKFDPRLKTVPAVRAQAAQINIEALLQTNPDFALGSETDMQAVEKATSLPTVIINTSQISGSMNQTKEEVKFFGKIFGKEDRANKYVAYLDGALNAIKSATSGVPASRKLKVYMGYNPDHLTTYGGSTYMDEWIEDAGLVNAAKSITTMSASEGGLATVSMEQILNWNPDIIVIDSGKPEAVYTDSTWSKLSAVQNKRVYRLPVGLFIWNRPSCEASVMLPQWLGLTAYPDKFKNTTISGEIKKFYSDVFGFTMTDSDITAILNP